MQKILGITLGFLVITSVTHSMQSQKKITKQIIGFGLTLVTPQDFAHQKKYYEPPWGKQPRGKIIVPYKKKPYELKKRKHVTITILETGQVNIHRKTSPPKKSIWHTITSQDFTNGTYKQKLRIQPAGIKRGKHKTTKSKKLTKFQSKILPAQKITYLDFLLCEDDFPAFENLQQFLCIDNSP